jgi:hypothetical protein
LSAAEIVSAAGAVFAQACELLELRQIQAALALFTKAETLGFSPDECAGGRWSCYMLAGEFERAWQESDLIWHRGAPDPNRLWSGRPLDGKKVIVRCLHGLGDAIQFIRFVPWLRRTAAAVHVEVPGCLVTLFRTIPEIDQVFTWESPLAVPLEWDEHIEVMELPWFFRVTPDSIPSAVPYLFPPEARKSIVEFKTSKLKIGLAWASSNWNPARSIPLLLLSAVLSVPGCSFYSLQMGPRSEDTSVLPPELVPKQIIQESDAVLHTASLMQQMDLVITVDTMIAHLAGALGKPVWLLLTQKADWRWMVERSDSPWYPTMRIFRQGADAKWQTVVEEVAGVLEQIRQAQVNSAYLPGNGTQPRVK